MSTKPPHQSERRRFFTQVTALPVSLAALQHPLAAAVPAETPIAPPASTRPYQPAFFTESEWAFVQAACSRLIPKDEHGPGALEAGVPEFIDRHMQTPYASGAIWYMQGPFIETKPEFGYQGKLDLKGIMRAGIADFDQYCKARHDGKSFAELDEATQIDLLKQAEGGKLDFPNISSGRFFKHLLEETRYGFFADPSHGGNKDMAGWKLIGYPGMRGDYLDWVEVRDRSYPLPPVDLFGNRG